MRENCTRRGFLGTTAMSGLLLAASQARGKGDATGGHPASLPTKVRICAIVAACLAAGLPAASAGAEDWPAYKKDAARSGVTAEGLSLPLAQRWAYQPRQGPRPAWPEPGKELHRTDFDYAPQPVAAGGLVYFGSSADDTVRALNAATGDQLCHIPGKYRVLISGGVVYAAGNGSIEAIDLSVVRRKRRIASSDARWTTPDPARVYCLAMAGATLLTGNRDGIAAYRAADGKPVWHVDLKGRQVRGMAVADGRLVAAMHTGELLCFGPDNEGDAAPRHVKEEARPSTISQEQRDRAKDIVERSGKSEGYALVLGEPDSRLAEALARQTRLHAVVLLGDRSALSRLKTNITHLFMGQPSWGHLVYADGVVLYGANAAYDAASGKKLWQKTIRPGKLPVVYGDRIITSASAYHLRTGEPCTAEDVLTGQSVPWRYSRAYGCGPVAGCRHVLFFRSGADGFFDMETEGTTNFGGVRSGCSRTLLAAGGLLIHAQGYSGCCCSYNFKTNLALVPAPDRGQTWYVLPRRAASGPVKHLAVNFGAPGDRKDLRGTAWLGFPRPLLDSACPAPVTVSMREAACAYHRLATAEIQRTDAPWVYSSALSGRGRIVMDLVLEPGVVLRRRDAAPAVDGKLDEACWKGAGAVPFQNTPFSMLGAAIDFRIFRDAENLYLGYHCPSGATVRDADEATPGTSDRLEIYVADSRTRTGIRLVVGRNGPAGATFGTVDTGRRTDPKWEGRWQAAVQETPDAGRPKWPCPSRLSAGPAWTSGGFNSMAWPRAGPARASRPSL